MNFGNKSKLKEIMKAEVDLKKKLQNFIEFGERINGILFGSANSIFELSLICTYKFPLIFLSHLSKWYLEDE